MRSPNTPGCFRRCGASCRPACGRGALFEAGATSPPDRSPSPRWVRDYHPGSTRPRHSHNDAALAPDTATKIATKIIILLTFQTVCRAQLSLSVATSLVLHRHRPRRRWHLCPLLLASPSGGAVIVVCSCRYGLIPPLTSSSGAAGFPLCRNNPPWPLAVGRTRAKGLLPRTPNRYARRPNKRMRDGPSPTRWSSAPPPHRQTTNQPRIDRGPPSHKHYEGY